MYMIRGSWDMLHLFCSCHGRELEMETSTKGLAYACQEKSEGGTPCNTRISIEE